MFLFKLKVFPSSFRECIEGVGETALQKAYQIIDTKPEHQIEVGKISTLAIFSVLDFVLLDFTLRLISFSLLVSTKNIFLTFIDMLDSIFVFWYTFMNDCQ